jgi:hypothetical protein
MLNCLGEEESATLARTRLIIDPSEEVLVQEVEQKEGRKREAIDDGGYDGIPERDYSQLGHRGKDSAPFRCARGVLALIY